jgi:hypothetical protein
VGDLINFKFPSFKDEEDGDQLQYQGQLFSKISKDTDWTVPTIINKNPNFWFTMDVENQELSGIIRE